MNSTLLLKAAPLLLVASLALGGARAAHAQGFTFTAPTTSALTANPGDSIKFSGTFTNVTALEQLDAVIIVLGPGNFGGKFTFASPFYADTLGIGQKMNFTGTLKMSSTATFSPTFFYLVANGTGDSSGENYDLTSDNFKVSLISAPVPETSAAVSFGLLLGGLGLVVVRSRKRRVTGA